MRLPVSKNNSAERGFTIVELLIVIVVIGILAAIVIVAYNGIQDRAKNTKYQTDATAIVKGAEAVNADLGAYPTGTDDASLTSSFNASGTFKIPSGVAVKYVTAAPTNTQAISDGDLAPRTYSVQVCAGAGTNVYWGQRGGSLQTAKAGPGC
jgi:prepilin-type N-terminal cleavage/methylation domain-containing protein